MNTYERESIGNIILMKNIVFPNHEGNKHEIDHSWKNGRPCIIIYSDENYDYFLPIKSTITDIKYLYHYIPLSENNLLYKELNRFGKYNKKKYSKIETKGYINIETIYKTPISWHDEIGKVKFKTYKTIIDRLKEYHKKKDLNAVFKEATIIKGR